MSFINSSFLNLTYNTVDPRLSEPRASVTSNIRNFFGRTHPRRHTTWYLTQMEAAPPAKKRKRKVLTIDQKLEIITKLEAGTSQSKIGEEYDIGRSTVLDIKRNKTKLELFSRKMVDMGMNKGTKIMKVGEYEKLDQALYVWFKQEREKNTPITGPIIAEKAKVLFPLLYPETSKPFKASQGFLWRFCKRHGVREISIQGEKLSADMVGATVFQEEFKSLVGEYSLDQIFNCDETGLYYRLLPRKTLACVFEKRADGQKKCKDRVTINACSNASGSIKLPLLFIGKSARPRCFRGLNMAALSVIYKNQKNAWVDSHIFSEWFHNNFVTTIQARLKEMKQTPKALLLLDNCSAHPDESELISQDGLVKAVFLPPNVTSLIQPMDQGVLEALKRRYRKFLLRDLLLSDDVDIIEHLKSINILKVIKNISLAWEEIS